MSVFEDISAEAIDHCRYSLTKASEILSKKQVCNLLLLIILDKARWSAFLDKKSLDAERTNYSL